MTRPSLDIPTTKGRVLDPRALRLLTTLAALVVLGCIYGAVA